MVTIEQQDLRQLVETLQNFPEFESEKSRRGFLPLVGLGPLLPRIESLGTTTDSKY